MYNKEINLILKLSLEKDGIMFSWKYTFKQEIFYPQEVCVFRNDLKDTFSSLCLL